MTPTRSRGELGADLTPPCLSLPIIETIIHSYPLFFLSALSATCEPEELVRILNDLFARFDKLANVSSRSTQ